MSTLPAASSCSGVAGSVGSLDVDVQARLGEVTVGLRLVEPDMVGVGNPVEHQRERLGVAPDVSRSFFSPQAASRPRNRTAPTSSARLRFITIVSPVGS